MTSFDRSCVLITGAASGIGRLMAQLAVDRGAQVVAWDRNGAGLASLAESRPGSIHPFVVDVTDQAAVAATADAVRSQVGAPDILILNAGVISGRRFLELPPAAIKQTFAVNTLALFWCAQAFLPDLVARDRGHVVTIASLAALTPIPGMVDYVASKHAAYGFAESLRTELAEDAPGVHTTVVLPQVIGTGMFAGVTTPRLFPVLEPEVAAEAIIAAVEKDRQRLLLNRLAGLTAYAARILPPRLSDLVSRAAGAFDGMATFHGRSIVSQPTSAGND